MRFILLVLSIALWGNGKDPLGVALTRIDFGNGLLLTILSLALWRYEPLGVYRVVLIRG
jgi:hypothetical protein